MMQTPAFWSKRVSWQAVLLAPLGWLYGAITLRRLARKGWRAPVPVISIGNFTAGGAGKTPTAIAVAEALVARGEVPFLLTRGYGGRERGPLRVDAARHETVHVGDEPLLLAKIAPTVVARDRAAGARLAIAQGASCLVLDDGLQNPALEKDFSLAVIDGGFGFGNGRCVPAGPLRAPVNAMRPHIDAVLVIGKDEAGCEKACHALGWPLFSSATAPDAACAAALADRPVVAFCGIGRPEKFRATLEALGAKIRLFQAFPDHHPYSDAEAQRLIEAGGDALLVTTEKDHLRLKGSPAREALAARSMPVPITIALEPALIEAIYRALETARRRSSTASGPA